MLFKTDLKRFSMFALLLATISHGITAQEFNSEGAVCLPVGPFSSGCQTSQTQPGCDTTCASEPFDGGCFNADGQFVSPACVCSNSANTVAAITDIEASLGIDIDDAFVAVAGYQGNVPSVNSSISVEDARTFFTAVLPDDLANELLNALNINGDGTIDRNEAGVGKENEELKQRLGCNFWAMDNLLGYLGLYLGNGSLDRYAGSLNPSFAQALQGISRTFVNSGAPLEPVSQENNTANPANAGAANNNGNANNNENANNNGNTNNNENANNNGNTNTGTGTIDFDQLNRAEAEACGNDSSSQACADARAASEAARNGN